MNNSTMLIDGFKTNSSYYQDTDSLNIEKEHWNKLNKAGYVGDNLEQEKKIIETVVYLYILCFVFGTWT